MPRALEDRFSPYRGDPGALVQEELGVEPEPYQRAVLEASADALLAEAVGEPVAFSDPYWRLARQAVAR